MFSSSKGKPDPKSDQKVYGCAVMSMDLYGTGIPWRGNKEDPKYINFNSEVVVRKGEEGWVINSKLDNYSENHTHFDYILTTYKYSDNQWKPDSKKWWSDKWTSEGDVGTNEITDSNDNLKYSVNTYNDKLVIKTPKESWWNGPGWISPGTGTHKIVEKNKTETKSWSGVWIDDANEESNSWIFQDIELYIKEKKNSLVFCDGGENTCFNTNQSSDKTNKYDNQNSDSWTEILKPDKTYNNTETLRTMLTNTVKPIIDKIKKSKGTWLDLETVCNLKGTRNLNDSQKKQLSMFCTNGKTSN